jgi:hypothetical protein
VAAQETADELRDELQLPDVGHMARAGDGSAEGSTCRYGYPTWPRPKFGCLFSRKLLTPSL